MKLTELCIKRPVLSIVMSLVIVMLGVVAFTRLQVRQYPNVDEPKISVMTQFEGASPEIIEAQVTKILEDALGGIEGLYLMTSRSDVGESRITLTFKLNRNIEDAANDVRDRIGRVRNKLPNDVTDPRIRKADADALPFMYLALYSDKHSTEELADYAFRSLESQLEIINGVSSVDIYGGGEYEMHLVLDPVKMAGYAITAEDVASAVKRANVEKPAGNIITTDREIVVTTRAPLISEKDFNNMIIAYRKDTILRLSDVGKAELKAVDNRNRVRFNDQNAIAIGLVKQSIANPLEIGNELKRALPRLNASLQKGMKLEVANDKTIFIERSINKVYSTLLEATLLVVLVILAFLRSGRAILIPIVTIPVSLIGAIGIMYALDFSVNTLTLLALVLAIGLVVDDAIVMLENIYRYIEEGMHPMVATFKGAREISFAVIAMTITLAAVYTPIALSTGMTGRLFTEFSLTLAGAVLISGFVALTLSPMMCGRLLRAHGKHQKLPKNLPLWRHVLHAVSVKLDRYQDDLDMRYAHSLRFALNHRTLLLMGALGISAVGAFVFYKLPSELLPREDQGVVNIRANPPYGANLEFVDKYMRQVDDLMRTVPEVEKRLTLVNVPGESTTLNLLKPWEERKRTSQQIVESLRDPLDEITGVSATPSIGGKALVSSLSEAPVEVVIKSTKPFNELVEVADQVMRAFAANKDLTYIQADYNQEGQEFQVTINREKAASLGVDVRAIAETLDTLISGRAVDKFKRENKLYNVKVEVEEKFRKSPDDVSGLFIRGSRDNKETMVPLAELITITKRMAPTEINHFEGLRSVTISAKLKPGANLGETLTTLKEKAQNIVPEGTLVDFAGESRRYMEESSNIALIFGLALIFIFLVLAAQYESFVDPIIIMLSVPLSLVSAVLVLMLTGQSLNIYSQIGLVTLIGLITKHGILIVDFANALKEKGMSREEAVIEACRLRLRPILMTTFAMVLGAIPLALSSGAGAESRAPIGWTVVGGMSLGTLFTLFIVPAFYVLLSSRKPKGDLSIYEAEANKL
ncbi:MAG: efflux RND transporter permease subunit [Holosporales bacterium]